jgi:hypothetical protein
LRRQAKDLDIVIETDYPYPGGRTYYVSPGDSWSEDPLDDGHYAHDLDELADLLRWYIERAPAYRLARSA